ncbi:MAG: hypothetical protein ACYDA8_22355 [Deferrisomatales bacterium]
MIGRYAAEEPRARVVEEAEGWLASGLVGREQADAIRARYRPDLVRMNFFLRLLLGVFTLHAATSVPLLPHLLFDLDLAGTGWVLLALAPSLWWLTDRLLIRRRGLYRCGVEEALLLCALGFGAAGLAILLATAMPGSEEWVWLAVHLLVLGLSAAGAVRYGHPLAALLAVLALVGLPFGLRYLLEWDWVGSPRWWLFALGAAVASGCHGRLEWARGGGGQLLPGYERCLETARFAALVALYAAANSYLHRLAWPSPEGSGWAGAAADGLCAALTAAIPGAALAAGIWRRDRALLWFGGLSAVASILTLNYFFHLGYLAEELTLAGGAVTAAAFGLSRWLGTGPNRRRGGFTAEPLLEPRLYGLDAEALAALQPLAPGPGAPSEPDFRPGGGGFGGAGAGGRV